MKKFKILSLIAFVSLAMQSCLFSEKDLFDESSANRANKSVAECKELLVSATNGWMMEYYTGSEAEFGGNIILAKFDAKSVTMASEAFLEISDYTPGDKITSFYKVVSNKGTELSFDSYNEIIHYFCEAYGYGDPGLTGDYEFTFREISNERIELTGKKYGIKLVMTRLAADFDWDDYIASIVAVHDNAPYATYDLEENGIKVTDIVRQYNAMTISSIDQAGDETVEYYPFVYTPTGIRFSKPMVVGGKSITNMEWKNAEDKYVSTDAGTNVSLVFAPPAGYLLYDDAIGQYAIAGRERSGANMIPYSGTVTLSENVRGRSYLLTGLDMPVIVKYDKAWGSLSLTAQNLGFYVKFYFAVTGGYTSAGYLPFTQEFQAYPIGFDLTVAQASPLKFNFTDNGVLLQTAGIPTDALIFHVFDGTPYTDDNFLGYYSWYDQLTMTKK